MAGQGPRGVARAGRFLRDLVRLACAPPAERGLLLRAAWLLVWLWPALKRRSLAQVRADLERRTRSAPPAADPATAIAEVRRALQLVSGSLPVPCTCLSIALAGQSLLRERGVDAEVRLGVIRDAGGAPAAHAWLVVDGGVEIGGREDLDAYRELVILPPTGPERRPEPPGRGEGER
jgi:hypothetical protein